MDTLNLNGRELEKKSVHIPASTIWEEILEQVPEDVYLFPHQKDSISWLKSREDEGYNGSICGDVMGLGKTLTAVTLISLNLLDRTLVICPNSLICQWSRLLKVHHHRVFFIQPKCARKILLQKGLVSYGKKEYSHDEIPTPFVGITTYGKVKAFPEPKHAKETEIPVFDCATTQSPKEFIPFRNITWDRIVVDEVHNLRNGVSLRGDSSAALRKKSLRFYRMLRLNKHEDTKILGLTGTPLMNRVGDLASIFMFLGFRVGRGTTDKEISSLILNNMFRRNASNLHPITKLLIRYPTEPYISRSIEVKYETAKEKDFYIAACGELGDRLNDLDFKINSADSMLLLLTLLRMLSSNPASYISAYNKRYPDNKIPKWKGTVSKFNMIEEQLQGYEQANESCVVFVHYYEEASMVGELNHGYENVEYLNGKVPMFDRDYVVNDAKKVISRGGNYLIIANIVACGEGLNMEFIPNVIISSMNWTPACEEQAIGRCHRIGASKPTTVTRYHHEVMKEVSENIDRRMFDKQKSKIQLATEMIEENPNAAWTFPVTNIPNYNVPCCSFPKIIDKKSRRKAITKVPTRRDD
jgi:superfamily II DNA or RNA helicase